MPRDLNVLFLTIDTLRADHLGCYGYARPTSPNLDALAARSTLFENGWAHAPSTRYSMPALATGRWPSAIDWDESIWWPRMRNPHTLAESLHALGYYTGGLFSFSYFALSDRRGFERGMDYYNADRAALHVAVNGPMESHGSSSREMADDAIAFLDAHKEQKFFLWLHFYDPHLSYEPHTEVPSFGSARADLYDGEIRFTDLHVGRVLEHLRALGIDGRTDDRGHRRPRRGAGRARHHRARLRSLRAADQGAVHHSRAGVAGAAARSRRPATSTWRRRS